MLNKMHGWVNDEAEISGEMAFQMEINKPNNIWIDEASLTELVGEKYTY